MEDAGTFDVVVVGAGIAGLVAGLRAAELGARVAVLEKGTGTDYPCNARYSGGIFHFAYRDPKGPAEEMAAAIGIETLEADDRPLARLLIEQAPVVVDWLRGHGARFIRGGKWAANGWMLAPPRALVAGLDWKGRGPDVTLRTLVAALGKKGGELHQGTRADTLAIEGGRCAGLEAERGGTRLRYRAGAVIIADGGFQADPDLLRAHVSPAPERLLQRGAATGGGDGLRMAMAAGATTTDLNYFYGHLVSRDAMHNDRVWPYPQLDELASAGILVDAQGRRFVDEGTGGIAMANVLARRADPLEATIVCDTPIWEGPGTEARIAANPQLEAAGGTVLRAGSLEELAGLAGLPAEPLVATVKAYNDALAGDALDGLSPMRSRRFGPPHPIVAPPFLALPVCTGITYTMGGLRIDTDARVMGAGGAPIEGLFAAGAAVGGVEGGPDGRYVSGLLKSGVYGMRAAESAVARVRAAVD